MSRYVTADVLVLGLVVGMLYAMLAAGFVLVYKTTRILNLAHGEIGGFAAIILAYSVLRLHLGFWPAFGLAILSGALVGAWVERAFIDKLRDAPRLVLLVATLGIAQLIPALNLMVLPLNDQARLSSGRYPDPFSLTLHVGGATLRPAAILTLLTVPVIAGALAVFLRYSRFGQAMRAVAENADNARLLGVSVRRVSMTAWALAGAMSAIAAVLKGGVVGTAVNLGTGPELLLRALAVAMAAGLLSLPRAALWGLIIGVGEQLVLYNVNNPGLVDALLFGFVVVLLLARRRPLGRAGELEESSWPISTALRTLPGRLANGELNRRLRHGVLAAAVVGAVTTGFAVDTSVQFALTQAIALAIGALSLTILTGLGGQISLGQWGIAGVAGFLAVRADLSWGWQWWATVLVAVVTGAVIALVIGLPALRLRGVLLALTTLAFSVAVAEYLFRQAWFTGGQAGLQVPHPSPFHGSSAFYVLCLALLAIAMIAARQIMRSRLGRLIGAVRENEKAASAAGISVARIKLTTFALSGSLAGLAGWVAIYGQGSATADSFSADKSFIVVAAAVVGGIGTVSGPVMGALLVGGLPRLFGDQSFLVALGTGVGVLQILMFLPTGLVTLPLRVRDLLVRGSVETEALTAAPTEAASPRTALAEVPA